MLHDEAAIALELAALSVAEIVDAASVQRAPRLLREAVERVAQIPSRRLGKILARFDARIEERGVSRAARGVLDVFGATVTVIGARPTGGALVVTNHPGAYDALATIAALGRDDVALVASERAFLRALPRLREHLVFVTDARTDGGTAGRAAGLRRALSWLESGRVLVQFGAGAIEPDARFTKDGEEVLGPWLAGTGLLASRAAAAGAAIVPAFVSGVHSRRAKMLPIVRLAEWRGITTIAPLIQATMPGFRDVAVTVRFGAPMACEAITRPSGNAERTRLLRDAVKALAPS